MKIKMRILVASYRRSDIAVELYGRTEDGKSVTALYFDFLPYFDIVEPDESCLKLYRADEQFIKFEDKKLWVDGKDRDVKRIYVKSPWLVPQLREKCGHKFKVLAADIPFHHRFIYDMDLGSCIEIDGDHRPGKLKYLVNHRIYVGNFLPIGLLWRKLNFE